MVFCFVFFFAKCACFSNSTVTQGSKVISNFLVECCFLSESTIIWTACCEGRFFWIGCNDLDPHLARIMELSQKKKTQTHVQQIRTEPPTPKLKCFLLIYTKKHPFTVMIVSIKNTCNFMGTNSKIRSPVFTSVINNETPEGRSTVL